MKHCVHKTDITQSSVIAPHVVQQQLYRRINSSSSHHSHCLLHSVQHYRKPVSLSGSAFTFIHFLISCDLSTQSIFATWKEPWRREDFSGQMMPAGPELRMQVYQRLPDAADKSWTVTHLRIF